MSEGNFLRLCNALRVWKDEQGFRFGGLLIDTLAHNFLEAKDAYKTFRLETGYDMLADMFDWLSRQNPKQGYWLALGSNQQVHDKGKGAFVRNADKAAKALSGAVEDEERRDALESLFGRKLKSVSTSQSKASTDEHRWARQYGYTPNEGFIEDMFPVDIRNDVVIDCRVTQKGFRPMALRDMLRRHMLLPCKKSLEFHIVETDVQMPYEVYWKVRNRGRVAFEKHMVRGELLKDTGHRVRSEETSFVGPHYVECYVVKDGVCVARDKIDVPISEVGRA
ncbi:MAG: hypothetical protein IJG82_09705 [Atopobiaceae bacterium]|nr:hypothetical protein [Atopobiaceae bacterium]